MRSEGERFHLAWRVILVIAAYFAATGVASLAIVIGLSFGGTGNMTLMGLLDFWWLAWVVTISLVLVPALVLILTAEWFGWRSLALHLFAGAAIGLAATALAVLNSGTWPTIAFICGLGTLIGGCAGSVYWWMAGQSAGACWEAAAGSR